MCFLMIFIVSFVIFIVVVDKLLAVVIVMSD